MDLSMPIMNGYEASKKIRDLEERYEIQSSFIIALSAHVTEIHREESLKNKMNTFSKIVTL